MEVEVSVCILAYNHEAFIEQAVKSVLAQKTTFCYEVIVRDDASTDGTAKILQRMQERYPNQVRLILEEKNRWADLEAKPVFGKVFAPVARGRYLATLEGDDFWTDERKLQRQYDYMEAHPTCLMCCHAVNITCDGTTFTGMRLGCGDQECDVGCAETLELFARTVSFGVWSIHPSSCFTRRDADLAYAASSWRIASSAGDYIRACYFSSRAPIHYDPKPMSAYRYLAGSSWTATGERDALVLRNHYEEYVRTMQRIDELTGYRYHDAAMRGSKQRALLLASMSGGASFFRTELGRPIAPYLTASDRMTLLALRVLFRLGLRPVRNTATRRIGLVRM